MAADVDRFGFSRLAVATLPVRLARPAENAEATLELARAADEDGVDLVVFPELGLTGYSNDDLFQQHVLLDAARDAIDVVREGSRRLRPVLVIGSPLVADARLYNTAVVIHRGEVLAVVPKSYLPNYREFYEKRQFSAAREAIRSSIEVGAGTAPFGSDILLECTNQPNLTVHVEICEDVWVPIPPSSYAALAGATVLSNLSASNITVAKADYRHELASSQSARLIAAYLYTSAGSGESTTDLAWDGHGFIYENGRLLEESMRFAIDPQLVVADVDLERLADDRMRMTSYGDCVADHRPALAFRRVRFELPAPKRSWSLRREFERFPFVPAGRARRDERCSEAYRIQVQGLTTRLAAADVDRLVLGISGGLDSTHALLVACDAVEHLGLPRTNILGYTMPGYATSTVTKQRAHRLMNALGVTAAEIDIRPSAEQMLRDLGHPAADGAPVYDITYENVQAGERTSHLFRLANFHGGLVVGTGDLSELALGWCTYGVGDQMSHYNVNASVPKTLMQHLIRWVTRTDRFDADTNAVLDEIVSAVISPELVPNAAGPDEIGQSTEEHIGPYELHDFFLYYTVRFGFTPAKVAYLAQRAWSDPDVGAWPDLVPTDRRRGYSEAEIRRWLEVFLRRFFQTSQFKRSAMPNGPKIGSGGSLSPRGDWRAPSDSAAAAWLHDLE